MIFDVSIHRINTYVTGYGKTDQIVTLGLFNFIGPADSYTHTLPMHCCVDWPS